MKNNLKNLILHHPKRKNETKSPHNCDFIYRNKYTLPQLWRLKFLNDINI